jgi:hypothetical protein
LEEGPSDPHLLDLMDLDLPGNERKYCDVAGLVVFNAHWIGSLLLVLLHFGLLIGVRLFIEHMPLAATPIFDGDHIVPNLLQIGCLWLLVFWINNDLLVLVFACFSSRVIISLGVLVLWLYLEFLLLLIQVSEPAIKDVLPLSELFYLGVEHSLFASHVLN